MKVTVKTLDSGSKEFDVSGELTVEKLKDEILKEMNIPLHQQRLIFQGKPLKDELKLKDCGVDGKVIHLVKRPPPSAARDAKGDATPETTPATDANPESSTGTVVTESTRTFVLPGGAPTNPALITQNIVDHIVSTLTSHGTDGENSADGTAMNVSGTEQGATVPAHSDAPPTDTPSTQQQSSDKATTDAPTSSAEKSGPTEMEVDTKPPEPSAPADTSSTAGPSTSSAAAKEEEVKTKPKEETEDDDDTRESRRRRNRSKNNTLYNHAKTVRRCLDFADRVLNRYDRGSARVKAKIAAEKRGESGEEVPAESWPEPEPMDVLESADGPSDEAKAGAGPPSDDSGSDTEIRGNLLIIKKERKSRRNRKGHFEQKYAILDDPDMPDLPASFYALMMEDLQAVHRRLSPLMEEYQRNAAEDRELTETEAVLAAQVALTVRDTVYYIGHGNVSLSRLHLNFLSPPPRLLRLAAPHKTEVRRVMMSMRRCFPSMHRSMHEPSGYIVDISRDNDGTQGERRTTRAVVNRSHMNVGGGMPGYGGMFGPMLGGILGGRRRFQPSPQSEPRPVPVTEPSASASALDPGPSQAGDGSKRKTYLKSAKSEDEKSAEVVLKSVDDVLSKEPCEPVKKLEEEYMEGWDKLPEEEVKKRERRNKRIAEQKALRDKIAQEAYHKDVEDMKKEEERWRKKQEEEKKKEEEERERKRKEEEEERKRLEEERRKKEEEERKRREQAEAMKASMEVDGQGGVAKEQEGGVAKEQEGGASGGGSDSTPTAEGEGQKKDDETPRYLARLLSELITGVADPAGPHRGSQPAATPGAEEGTTASAPAAEQKEESGEKKDPPPRKSFAERYAGPEGTTVTIQAAPTAPFGLPVEGPSLSIRNPGAGAEPEMTINFPVPPAIHLLQTLLERAEERHKERQANGESSSSSSSSSSDEDGDDEGEGGSLFRIRASTKKEKEKKEKEKDKEKESDDDKKKKKKKKTRPHIPRPFIDADGEVGSTSEAGELDSMDTDNEGPAEFNDRSMEAGEHMTMLEAMREVRGKIGMNPENESEDEEERHVNTLEQFLKMISRELKVKEVVKILRGDVGCLERTQPDFQEYIKDKLLDGAEATKARKEQAICKFLEHVQPSLEAIKDSLPVRDTAIDMVETVVKLLYHLLDELYEHIINSCTIREQVNKVFSKRLHKWARESTQLFACVIRHCVDGDHLFDDMISKLVAQLFPPSTPKNILHVCIDSILKWLDRARKEAKLEPLELDRYVCWKEQHKSNANYSYTLASFVKEGMPTHDRLVIPYPPRESCPGGDEEEEGTAAAASGVPAGVPEEWVSTIDRDSEAHPKREGPQQPYSDAYLSGMPAKKRKLDTSEPCTKSTQDFLYEAMEYAIPRAGVTSISGHNDPQMLSLMHHCPFVAGGLSANVHQFHRERLLAAGATVEQYPNAMEFYHLDPKAHEERLDK